MVHDLWDSHVHVNTESFLVLINLNELFPGTVSDAGFCEVRVIQQSSGTKGLFAIISQRGSPTHREVR